MSNEKAFWWRNYCTPTSGNGQRIEGQDNHRLLHLTNPKDCPDALLFIHNKAHKALMQKGAATGQTEALFCTPETMVCLILQELLLSPPKKGSLAHMSHLTIMLKLDASSTNLKLILEHLRMMSSRWDPTQRMACLGMFSLCWKTRCLVIVVLLCITSEFCQVLPRVAIAILPAIGQNQAQSSFAPYTTFVTYGLYVSYKLCFNSA